MGGCGQTASPTLFCVLITSPVGSRLQKYWACGRVLITLVRPHLYKMSCDLCHTPFHSQAPLSKSCLLELNKENLDELNKLLHHLRVCMKRGVESFAHSPHSPPPPTLHHLHPTTITPSLYHTAPPPCSSA